MPYPPCDSCAGERRSWPQLVGKPAAEAKATIERDMPGVTAVIISTRASGTTDFCCNRVWVVVNDDPQRTVAEVPIVG
ncbi:hypothetical protein MKW94_013842 [Papaver nudicaule]|uniref:Uncharacterized protein n=1 Tax=Papaver nudicaule TaxID=74823 RepID=A0AA41RT63_PAPNU|nr:hypothetical protein [Papaver nudicaule]